MCLYETIKQPLIHTAKRTLLILTLFTPQWKGTHSRTPVFDQNKVESAAVFEFSWDSNSRQLTGHLSLFQLNISMDFFEKERQISAVMSFQCFKSEVL